MTERSDQEHGFMKHNVTLPAKDRVTVKIKYNTYYRAIAIKRRTQK